MQYKKQYKLLIRIIAIVQNASWGGFLIGYTSSELALSSDHVAAGLGATSQDQTDLYNQIFLIILPIGGIVGTILFYHLSQFTSRRNIIILSDIIFILGLFIGYNKSFTFAILRFFQGISNAFNFCGVLLYIREIAPDQWADKAVLLFQINLNLGIIMANVLSLPLPDNTSNVDYYWRIIFVFPMIICFLRMYCLIFVYDFETPYYYYQMNQQVKQAQLIKLIYKEEYAEEIEYQLQQIGKDDETKSSTYQFRKYYCIFMLSVQQMTGINVGIYSNDLYEDLFSESIQTKLITLLGSLLLLASAIVSFKFEHKIKRKTKVVGFNCIILFCLNMVLIYSIKFKEYSASFISLNLFYIVFNFSLGPLCLSIVTDMHKEKGIAISFTFYWIFNLLSICIGQFTTQEVSLSIFAMFSLIGFFVLFFKNKETKGLPYYQIISSNSFREL